MQKIFGPLVLGVLLILVLLTAIYYLSPILAPFVTGIILAYLGDPLVDRLVNYKVNRTVAVIIVFLIFIMVLVAALLVVVPMVVRELTALVQEIPQLIGWLQSTASPWLVETFKIDPFNISLDNMKQHLVDNWQQTGGIFGRLVQEATASGATLLAAIASIALTPIVAFYMMRDWDGVVRGIHSIIPRGIQPSAVELARSCDNVLSEFLRGQLLIMFFLGCIYALGLSLMGLKLALVIGMLAGLASIVPYLGFAVGILAAGLAALFQFQDAIHLVFVLIVFLVGQGIESMVLTPWLIGDRIGLHPVAVIFAVLAGGQLFGFVGILLALPVAAVIMVFVRHLRNSYINSSLFDNTQPPSDSVP